jgi:hypothetical protein
MSKPKSAAELERDIAAYLARKPDKRARARLPYYDERKGWRGGDTRTLYAYVGQQTGQVVVRPGGGAGNIGPAATVRIATRDEAERLWQSPLHSGWRVA